MRQEQSFAADGKPPPEYVFTTGAGTIICVSQLHNSFKRMLLNAGVTPRKFHAMRHTFATQALQRGVDVKDLQLIMGHANIQTTYGYIAVDMEAKRRAIERMGVMI